MATVAVTLPKKQQTITGRTTPQPKKVKEKMAVSEEVAKILRKVEAQILKEPHTFCMADWYMKHGCGTTACIAGWVSLLSPEFPRRSLKSSGEIAAFAKRKLGLNLDTQRRMFFVGDWPQPYQDQYLAAGDNADKEEQVKIAVKRIEHFIKTGR